MKKTYKNHQSLVHLTKLDAFCDTIISLLFLMLVALFTLFVLDITNTINLTEMIKFIRVEQQEVAEKMPFISAVEEIQQDSFYRSEDTQDSLLDGPQDSLLGGPQDSVENMTKQIQDSSVNTRNVLQKETKLQSSEQSILTSDIILKGQQPISLLEKKHKRTNILKPALDTQNYTYFEMVNGMKVVLVNVEQSLADVSLNIQVGSWNDPKDHSGLAHMCGQILGSHNDKFNAITDYLNQYIDFQVDSEDLMKTLDDLSRIMEEKQINRYLSSVNESNSGVGDQLMNLFSILSDPSHPASRYQCNPNTVQVVRQFYDEHYTANRMSLVVKSSLSSIKLKQWINEQSGFMSLNDQVVVGEVSWGLPLQQNLGSVVKYQSVRAREVTLLYQLPSRESYVRSKPLEYIDYFIGSTHEGGLIRYLRQQNFIEDFHQATLVQDSYFSTYSLNVQLQERDDLDSRELAYRFAKITNSYLRTLKHKLFSQGLDRDFYEEQRKLAQLNFIWKDNYDVPALELSKSLQKYGPNWLLAGETIFDSYDSNAVILFLDSLIDPNNLIILVGSDEYKMNDSNDLNVSNQQTIVVGQGGGSDPRDLQFLNSNDLQINNQFFNQKYSVQKMSNQTMNFIREDDSIITGRFVMLELSELVPNPIDLQMRVVCQDAILGISAQEENELSEDRSSIGGQLKSSGDDGEVFVGLEFIEGVSKPQDYSMYQPIDHQFTSVEECNVRQQELEAGNAYLQLIHQTRQQQVWLRLDRSLGEPRVSGTLQWALPLANSQVEAMLLAHHLQQQISEDLDGAMRSGFTVSTKSLHQGIQIQVQGFSSNVRDFFAKLWSCINPNRSGKLNLVARKSVSKEFQKSIRTIKQQLQNKINLLQDTLPMLLQYPYYSPHELLTALERTNIDEIISYQTKLFQSGRLTGVFVGNILQEETLQIMKIMEINQDSQIEEVPPRMHVANLRGQNLVFAMQGHSSSTLNYYQVGHMSNSAPLLWLSQQMQSKDFVVEVVAGGISVMASGDTTPDELNKRVEEFLEQFQHELQEQSNPLLVGAEYLSRHSGLKKDVILDLYREMFLELRGGKLSVQTYGSQLQHQLFGSADKNEFRDYVKKQNNEVLFTSKQFAKRIDSVFAYDNDIPFNQ